MKGKRAAFGLMMLIMGCNLVQVMNLAGQTTLPSTDDRTQAVTRTIVYWRFIWLDSGVPEADMIEVFPQAVLDRIETSIIASDDPAANIRFALQRIIDSPDDRLWETETMTIADVQVVGTAATIALDGDIMVFGGGVAYGTALQLALTVFEEPGIETALITINGINIANLVVDHESQRRPDAYVYTRALYDELVTNR